MYRARHCRWSRTIILSSILNDRDCLDLALIQDNNKMSKICDLMAIDGNRKTLQYIQTTNPSLKGPVSNG